MAIDFDAEVRLADLRLRVQAWNDFKQDVERRQTNKEHISQQDLDKLADMRPTPEQYRDLYLDLRRGRDMAAAATKAAAARARKLATPAKPTIDIHALFSGCDNE